VKAKSIVLVILVLVLSVMFAHGGSFEDEASDLGNIDRELVELNLKIIDLDDYLPVALAIDKNNNYYILNFELLSMYYENLSIDIGEEIKVKGILTINFDNVKGLMVNTAEIDSKNYVLQNYIWDMVEKDMIDYCPWIMGGNGFFGMMMGRNHPEMGY